MDAYKELKKVEYSFQGKLSRRLNKLFNTKEGSYTIKGLEDSIQVYQDKPNTLRWSYANYVFSKDRSKVIDLEVMNKHVDSFPSIILENKEEVLTIVNELRDELRAKSDTIRRTIPFKRFDGTYQYSYQI